MGKEKEKPMGKDLGASRDTFTDTRRVRELVELMARNQLVEIELVERDSKIKLKRAGPATASPPHAAGSTALQQAPPADTAAPAAEAEKFASVRSPMVGTFYSAANPESDAYVTIGSQVTEDTVVCVIEAMKVFNEIRAETTGTIAKVLVQNGQAVEFNQPLFLLKP